jgi:hypothetical protein
VTSDRFKPPGGDSVRPVFETPPSEPPFPTAQFGVHSSSNGFDFAREAFGYAGEAFVAQFGDMTPGTGKVLGPVGFRVVRVDVEHGIVHEFASNRGNSNGPASLLETGGLERPVAARFDPSGAMLYVVDFGIMTTTEQGPRPRKQTGVIWRIRRA